jgi:hypothetical protein
VKIWQLIYFGASVFGGQQHVHGALITGSPGHDAVSFAIFSRRMT